MVNQIKRVMKELSIEQKAKRYDEALERARRIYDTDRVSGIELTTCEEIFPELRESEDERIRKWLIAYLENRVLNTGILEEKDSCKEAIAWLEEQKPVEEINSEDYGIDGLYVAMDILNETLGQVEGYQSDDGILEHKAAMTAVKKLYKQRPAEWSEKDKRMLESVIYHLRNSVNNGDVDHSADELEEWLKSLCHQSKQE